MPVGRRSQPYVGAGTHTGYECTSTSSAVATHEQRNCRSSGKVLNLQIVLDWASGAISPMAKCWTTKAGHARCRRRLAIVSGFSEGVSARGHTTKALPAFAGALNARRLANDEIDRDVGEHDAMGRHRDTERNQPA